VVPSLALMNKHYTITLAQYRTFGRSTIWPSFLVAFSAVIESARVSSA
jgi:hypothetical protein